MSGVPTGLVQRPSTSNVVRRKSPKVIDAIRSPARERRDVYVETFSLSSRSGPQLEIVNLYVSEFVADDTNVAAPVEARKSSAFRIVPIRVLMDAVTPIQERQLVALPQ